MTDRERSELIVALQQLTGERIHITVDHDRGDIEWKVRVGKRRYIAARVDRALMAALDDIANDPTVIATPATQRVA